MKYLLDTCICIDIMHGEAVMAERLDGCRVGEVGISSITLAELEYGILRAPVVEQGRYRMLLEMLRFRVSFLDFDAAAARAYAQVRQADPQRNRNALDKLIAAHALGLGAVLVTSNETDFRRVPGLTVENWAAG